MKSHFARILTLCIMLSWHGAQGQPNIQEAQYKYGKAAFRKFLNVKLHEEMTKNNVELCAVSVVFAKFTIDIAGNTKNLSFSGAADSSMVLRNILANVIKSTNGSWIPYKVNGKTVDSKPFLLPLIYEMEAGCRIKNTTATNTMDIALTNMLNFDGNAENNATGLNCILLEPFIITSLN